MTYSIASRCEIPIHILPIRRVGIDISPSDRASVCTPVDVAKVLLTRNFMEQICSEDGFYASVDEIREKSSAL